MEHMKEPWVVDGWIINQDGFMVAAAISSLPARVRKANARRIVACVNACRDVPRDYLDDLKPGDMMKALEWLYGIRKPIESER